MLLYLNVVAALAGAATSLGNARVVNNCPFEVTTWSVGSRVSGPFTLQTGGTYSEPFASDPKTGGRALKTTRERDGLYAGKPQTIFAYSLRDNAVWYDLSNVFGNAFQGNKLVVASGDAQCDTIAWADGTPPAGSQVKTCQQEANVTLTLCGN